MLSVIKSLEEHIRILRQLYELEQQSFFTSTSVHYHCGCEHGGSHHTDHKGHSSDPCGHHPKQEFLIMSVVTTDDNAVRVRPTGLDVDGVKTTPTDLTASIDNPAVAEVVADSENPGAFLIKRLPATDPNAGALTTVATFTTPAGISASVTVEFDPGTETSLALETELVPGAAAAKAPDEAATV